MANNPEKALLEWMAIKPRTLEWDAVLAYDRAKCNMLLRQEYIEKFNSDTYMPAIDKAVATGEVNWEYLYNWITDAPRLSFEESSLTQGGEVNMTMAMVGGSQITIDRVLGIKRAIKVTSLDALDAPELIAQNVLLKGTKGSINDAGEVVLDLGDAETAAGIWELSFANTQHERRIGGNFFKKHFKDNEEKRRTFHLGKIAFTDQQYLKPESFKLRTVTAPGAQSHTAANYGDGAVEVFVSTDGSQQGGIPGQDWKYLIPNDLPGEYDSTIILSNKIVMHRVLAGGVKRLFDNNADLFEAPPATGFTTRLRAKPSFADVRLWFQPAIYRGNGFSIFFHAFNFYMGTDFSLNILQSGVADETVAVEWARSGATSPVSRHNVRVDGSPPSFFEMSVALGVNALGKFEVNADSGTISLRNIPPIISHVSIPHWESYYEIVNKERNAINAHVLRGFEKYLDDAFKRFFEVVGEIDLFVLNSIIFDSSDAVKLKSVSLPGDMAVFGKISPRLTSFSITPLESLMGHGATQPFSTVPARTGLTWSVANIPGSTGNPGSITNSGVYTSPAIADIPGTFTRVKVTATDPATQYSSSALVTVVVRDITVNPLIQLCNASVDMLQTRELSANTLGDGTLEWSVIKGTGRIPKTARPDRKNTYTAGPKDTSIDESFTLDEIQVKNLKTGKTQSSYVLVNHLPADLEVAIDMAQSSFPQGKAQLVASRRDKPVAVTWKIIAGSGSINMEGLYTVDPNGQHQFALITALKNDEDGDFLYDGFIIVPLPLLELPDKPAELPIIG